MTARAVFGLGAGGRGGALGAGVLAGERELLSSAVGLGKGETEGWVGALGATDAGSKWDKATSGSSA